MQIGNFFWHDHTAAAAKDFDMCAAALLQQINHVFEVLDVAALVTGNGDTLRVFLQRCGNDFFDGTVVAEMDHFCTIRHQNTAHDVDRGVMAIEQRSGGDETHLIRWFVFGQILGYGQVGHVFLNSLFFGKAYAYICFIGWLLLAN